MKRWLSPCVLAALSVGGCSDARLVDGFSEGQTRIRVSPAAFVGAVPCLRGASGALQSYVARVQQLDADGQLVGVDGGASTDLVSAPVPCDRDVLFPAVADQLYAAEISGFDSDLMEADASAAAPRWLAACGQGSASAASDAGVVDPLAPTRAVRGATVLLRGCTAFSELTPGTGRSQLAIDVDSALGELACGSGPGQVGFLEASLGPSRASALCGEPLVLDVDGPARFHTVTLTGFELGPDAGVVLVDGGMPSTPPTALDAGPEVTDAAVDAGPGEAGTPGVPAVPDAAIVADAGLADAGLLDPSWVGIPRWRSECLGRSLPGVVSVATCEVLKPLTP